MTKIKICGVRRIEEINYCNELQPDFIGFVFANSKRQVNVEEARTLRNHLSKKIKTVGVFVNEDIDKISNIANEGIIDLIQLHGNESEEYIESLRIKTLVPIIKAYKDSPLAKYILLDNETPGSGKTFNWDSIHENKPMFLAGGINSENILEALNYNPYCIDISSGVETNGYKDYFKIKEIIRMVRENER